MGLVWEPLDALDPLAKQVTMVEAICRHRPRRPRQRGRIELLRTICGVLHCPLPPVLEH